ncbi:MAG: D-alanyl-D-alanine carboxypeptidase [Clostridia bacterium]|nr:D-alanyl-D-alanine carboxypeptidase [Clostridia bacterium]
MKKGLRILSVLLCIATVFTACSIGLSASIYEPAFDLEAEGIYVVNEDTGLTVFSKNADTRLYPASMTKVMAALLVLEQVPDLSVTATMNQGIATMISGTGSVVLGLKNGEVMSMEDLLYAFMLKSAGDAVLLAAEAVGGTVDNFVAMMNERAQGLGCADTHFTNPHGLHDDNHYSTPADMYKIVAEAMKNARFREICGTTRYTIPATNKSDSRLIVSTNLMLSANLGGSLYYEPVNGIKTGFTTPAGPCLASTATKNNETYTVIIMKSTALNSEGNTDRNGAFVISKKLYEWLFSSYKLQTLLTDATVLKTVEVRYGKNVDSIGLVPSDDFITLLPKNADQSSVVINYNVVSSVDAPLQAGTELGTAYIEISGERAGEIKLVAAESVERNDFLYVMAQIGAFFSSTPVIVVGVVLIVLIIGYIALNIAYNRGRKRRSSGSYGSYSRKTAARRRRRTSRPRFR